MKKAREWNFDGIVGPTHNYAGLSSGNLASTENAKSVSSPRAAAIQGLRKMKTLADRGFAQGVLAPQARPDLETLRRLGFTGKDADVVEKSFKRSPELLAACYSASSMWTANAATISPSSDCENGKVNITPANLVSKFHRSLEHGTTTAILKKMFASENHFEVHSALPMAPHFGDEGAANHNRFCESYGERGLEFFVYGQKGFDETSVKPKKYVARQTFEASRAVARKHGLSEKDCFFALQNPDVIDRGVFHNDVISVCNLSTLFAHEEAFYNKAEVYRELQGRFSGSLEVIEVPKSEVSVEDAVSSYLFNSQLLSLSDSNSTRHSGAGVGDAAEVRNLLVAPEESKNNTSVSNYLKELVDSGESSIEEVLYMDVTESMKNGGGPACLRLRVVLTAEESKAMNQEVVLTDSKFAELNAWVEKNYRESLELNDLRDPKLITESYTALDELTQILTLGSVYSFQK